MRNKAPIIIAVFFSVLFPALCFLWCQGWHHRLNQMAKIFQEIIETNSGKTQIEIDPR